MTANEKAKEALEFYAKPENWRNDDWGVPSVVLTPEYGNPGQLAREALTALEAEKPAEDAWGIARQVYDKVKESEAFNPFDSARLIQSYAESYHAAMCKDESAAILAASDRLGAALDESDKVR